MASTTPDLTYTQNDIPGFLALAVTLADGTVVDLTGATSIVFSLKVQNGTIKIARATGSLWTDPADNVKKLRFDWRAGDLDTTGKYWGEFEFHIGSTIYSVPTNPKLYILVVAEVD